jgi:hypothetical protein
MPDGEGIASMTAYVYDNYASPTGAIGVWLDRFDYTTGIWSEIGFAITESNSTAIQEVGDTSIVGGVVDSSKYGYNVYVCFSPDATDQNHRLYAVKIDFAKMFIPVILKNYCGGFLGPHEVELNDTAGQANGPLCFGQAYTGDPDEHGSAQDSDYFYVEVGTNGTLSAQVTGFLPDHAQLQLRDAGLNLLDIDVSTGDDNYSVSDSVTPGRYYIRAVSTDGHTTGNGDYTLTVNFS